MRKQMNVVMLCMISASSLLEVKHNKGEGLFDATVDAVLDVQL